LQQPRPYATIEVSCPSCQASNPEAIMKNSRRRFLQTAGAACAAAPFTPGMPEVGAGEPRRVSKAELDRILDAPVLDTSFVDRPVTVASLELLKNGRNFLVRARSTAGVEALTVPNPARMRDFYRVFLGLVPVFLNKDARQLEALLWDAYRFNSNYKLQGLALWTSVAAMEMALLELLAQTAQRPLADLFGGARRRDIAVYYASGNRGNRPEAEVDYLRRLVADSGVRALKFRLGGRMSRNEDSLPGRSEALIPLARQAFGDAMTLYADANSSYDVAEAVRIGRIMQEHRYGFYEEPCPFDWLWETKEVADALTMPVAGGEQEYSLRRWQWAIEQRGLDIVQPDLHYGGGLIRATKVARMAAAAGLTVVPHMSGGGLGYLDVVHFASFTPNIGPFMEFKGNADLPVHCTTSSLRCANGVVRCPSGPGFGVTIDADFVQRAVPVRAD
jgi:D-galactarolactone cycloisomerase